jgi:cytochrome P450
VATTPATELAAVDLFSDEALEHPYPLYAHLRAAGGAVYLERYDAFALPRYAEASQALRDWQTFSSAEGTAMDAEVNRLRAGNIISTDPPDHTVLRRILARALGPRAVRQLTEEIGRRADELVERCVDAGSFDAIADLAQPLPIGVICDLVGFPEEGRDELLDSAHASFNTFGPMNERALASVPQLEGIWEYLAAAGRREGLPADSVGAMIHDAADAGEIRADQVLPLLFAFATAGMETTVSAIGSAVWLLASDPDAWAAVRANPELAAAAFKEAIRVETPIQVFTRVCRREVEIDGVRLPEGARIITMFGSANRDEAKWERADRFEVARNPVDHLAFGHGIHRCLGVTLAELEGQAVLRSLARSARTLEAGEPVRKLNNILRGLEHLPIVARR